MAPGSSSRLGGAARMGRLRHRRARSDMPEYYPLSPLESPLHTAMPQEDDANSSWQLTHTVRQDQHRQHYLGPVASAAAVVGPLACEGSGLGAATAAALPAQRSEPAVRAQDSGVLSAEASAASVCAGGGVDAGLLGTTAVLQPAIRRMAALELPANPLGSPLRHGLTSPAARYRLRQQQQLRETGAAHGSPATGAAGASSPRLGVEGSAAAAAAGGGQQGTCAANILQQEGSRRQHSIGEAVARAVADYHGSMSPRRLARIQDFVSGLVSLDSQGGHGAGALAATTAASSPHKACAADVVSGDAGGLQQQHIANTAACCNEAELTFSGGAFLSTVGMSSSMQASSSLQLSTRTVAHDADTAPPQPQEQQQQRRRQWQQPVTQVGVALLQHDHAIHQPNPSTSEVCWAQQQQPAVTGTALHQSGFEQQLQQQECSRVTLSGDDSHESLPLEPSSEQCSWPSFAQHHRGSQDSAQIAVMQSQGALLAPAHTQHTQLPSVHTNGTAAGHHSDNHQQLHLFTRVQQRTADNRGQAGADEEELPAAARHDAIAAAAAAFGGGLQHPLDLLAGLAVLGLSSVDSTAGSGAVQLHEPTGSSLDTEAAAAAAGGLLHGVVGLQPPQLAQSAELARRLVASVEQLVASLNMDESQVGAGSDKGARC